MESSRITTSRLCSTQALGLFDDHFGDLHVALAGSSKVDDTTSPFTERAISVTSSGRSSISKHDQGNSRG